MRKQLRKTQQLCAKSVSKGYSHGRAVYNKLVCRLYFANHIERYSWLKARFILFLPPVAREIQPDSGFIKNPTVV